MGTDRPKLLDLYCGAGGASMGYYRAGFDVTGVDWIDQPNYPFRFIKGDALSVNLSGYDVIHASPPCQAYSWAAKRWHKPQADLVAPTRELLRLANVPYVIENVIGAPLLHPDRLCGTSFDLMCAHGVLYRHRLFESNFAFRVPECRHDGSRPVTVAGHGANGCAKYDCWKQAMGIDWMTRQELTQAIPPAYTHYIGTKLWDIL